MANLPWLNEVLGRLAKHALPPTYVQRFAEELSDHLEDFTEENMGTEADAYSRLGQPEQVAEAAVAAYRRRSFLGRHPTAAFLVFAVSPLVSLIVITLVIFFAFAMSCVILGYPDFIDQLWLIDKLGLVAWGVTTLLTIVIPSILVSILYCELANCLGISRKWMFVSCTVLATMAGTIWWCATPGDSNRVNSLLIYFGFHSPLQLAQFMFPLVVGWWFARRKRDQSYPLIAFSIFVVSPVVSLIVLMQLACFGVELLVFGLHIEQLGINLDSSQMKLGTTTLGVLPFLMPIMTIVIPSILLGILYCGFARRLGIGRKWTFVPCAVLAVIGGSICCSYPIFDSAGYCSLWSGFGFYSPMQLGQFIVPLAIGWWFLRRNSDRGQLQLTS